MSTDDIQARLFARDPPPLVPKAPWNDKLKKQIAALQEHRYIIAALHLANDDIYACHDIVQADEGEPTADLMHALLHRREGDAFNSKYWFSRMRRHALCPEPAEAKRFVDACERREAGCEERQWDELRELVRWTRETYKSSADP